MITYREIQRGEEINACCLVMDCFNEYVAPGYIKEGVAEFSRYVDPDLMKARIANNHFVILAMDHDNMAGVIEVRNNNHISLFFVKKDHQHQGIGRKLHELAIEKCRTLNPEVTTIDVHSSPYAVHIYQKLGFIKQSEEQISNGIRYTPLILHLKPGLT